MRYRVTPSDGGRALLRTDDHAAAEALMVERNLANQEAEDPVYYEVIDTQHEHLSGGIARHRR